MPPEIAVLAGFSVIMALGQFSPGPDMLWLTRVALRDGGRAGVITALGIACGLAVHATLALTGLALLLHRSPPMQFAFTFAAAAYLGWLAFRIMRESGAGLGADSAVVSEIPAAPGLEKGAKFAGKTTTARPFLRGLLCNLANPKVAILLAAICTPFIESSSAPWFTAALWMIIVIQGGILWSLWAVVLQAHRARAIYQNHARRIDVAFATALAVLAIWLLITLLIGADYF